MAIIKFKSMKKVILYFTFIALLTSCSQIIVPYHTTVDKITIVKPGMSKQNVIATLGIEPYEIYHGVEDGCEIHHFKYKHKEKYFGTLNSFGKIKGSDRYVDPSNLYVYYRDGKMESLITDNGKDLSPGILAFSDELNFECNGGAQPIYGCMDKDALNYNKEATVQRDGDVIENGSTIMIGDCEYCACDYIPNSNYDSKKNCGDKCIPIHNNDSNIGNEEVTYLDPDCTLCDLAEKENAQINVNIDFDNEAPRYNGYISKLFGNQLDTKSKSTKNKKHAKKKKNVRKNESSIKSKNLSAGLAVSSGVGLFVSKEYGIAKNIVMSNSLVYYIDKRSYNYGTNAEFVTDFTPTLKSLNDILFNLISSKNYSLKAGVGSGIAIGSQYNIDNFYGPYVSSGSVHVEPLSLAVSNQFNRFGLSLKVPVVVLDNYLSPAYLGINFNF